MIDYLIFDKKNKFRLTWSVILKVMNFIILWIFKEFFQIFLDFFEFIFEFILFKRRIKKFNFCALMWQLTR